MSLTHGVVITFRLNERDPYEATALEYLRAEMETGKGARQVISDALVAAAKAQSQMDQVLALQQRAVEILEKLESGVIRAAPEVQLDDDNRPLSEAFKAGALQLVKKYTPDDD